MGMQGLYETCRICDQSDSINIMVDCPKYYEKMEKGSIPGWIHKNHCEKEFKKDSMDCIESCDDDQCGTNISNNMDLFVDLSGLIKMERNGVEVYNDANNICIITFGIDGFIETFKPLNIVVDDFEYVSDETLYVKDNINNIHVYKIDKYDELLSRFDYLNVILDYEPELFCTKDGVLFIIYEILERKIGAMLAPLTLKNTDIKSHAYEIVRDHNRKYLEAEEFFGVTDKLDRPELKKMIQTFSENELIQIVLCQLLKKEGYKGVKPIAFHGPGEAGGDIHPFYKENEFGNIVYYSAQAKAKKIHASSSKKEGNVNELINQVAKLLRTSFISFLDNSRKKIGHVFIFCSQEITRDAQHQLFNAFENMTNINIIEIDTIVDKVIENDLIEEIMNYQMKRRYFLG